MDYKKTVLPNGLRIITNEMPQMRSVATTVFIGAGSRYENPKINGISHFLEHMLFKGTKRWPNQAAIAEAIEGIGGHLNAWTDQDHTAYWNQVPAEHGQIGLDVISDMLFAPLLEQQAIDRERGVISEEINMRLDDPSSYVVELMIELLWPNQPMGWAVIGTRENIMSISQTDFKQYLENLYNSNSIVVSVAGNIKHEDVVAQVEKLFKPIKKPAVDALNVVEEQAEPKVNTFYKKTDQAHLALGVRGLSHSDPDKYIWDVLNTVLGHGMSSRLFMNIREDKGLAYYIRSMVDSFKDTGVLTVHAGLNIDKLEKAVEAIIVEFKRLCEEKVSEAELNRVKEYIKGSLNLSMDDTDTVSSWYGRQELLMPKTLTPDELISIYEKVTPEDIMRVAKRVFQDKNFNLAIVSPVKDGEKFKKLLTMK